MFKYMWWRSFLCALNFHGVVISDHSGDGGSNWHDGGGGYVEWVVSMAIHRGGRVVMVTEVAVWGVRVWVGMVVSMVVGSHWSAVGYWGSSVRGHWSGVTVVSGHWSDIAQWSYSFNGFYLWDGFYGSDVFFGSLHGSEMLFLGLGDFGCVFYWNWSSKFHWSWYLRGYWSNWQVGGFDLETVDIISGVFYLLYFAFGIYVAVSTTGDAIEALDFSLGGKMIGVSIVVLANAVLGVVLAGDGSWGGYYGWGGGVVNWSSGVMDWSGVVGHWCHVVGHMVSHWGYAMVGEWGDQPAGLGRSQSDERQHYENLHYECELRCWYLSSTR